MSYENKTDIVIIVLDAVLQILKGIRKLCGLKSKKKGREDFIANEND